MKIKSIIFSTLLLLTPTLQTNCSSADLKYDMILHGFFGCMHCLEIYLIGSAITKSHERLHQDPAERKLLAQQAESNPTPLAIAPLFLYQSQAPVDLGPHLIHFRIMAGSILTMAVLAVTYLAIGAYQSYEDNIDAKSLGDCSSC